MTVSIEHPFGSGTDAARVGDRQSGPAGHPPNGCGAASCEATCGGSPACQAAGSADCRRRLRLGVQVLRSNTLGLHR